MLQAGGGSCFKRYATAVCKEESVRVAKAGCKRSLVSKASCEPIEIEDRARYGCILAASDRVLGLHAHQSGEERTVILRFGEYCILPDTLSVPTRYLSQSKSPCFPLEVFDHHHRNLIFLKGDNHFPLDRWRTP